MIDLIFSILGGSFLLTLGILAVCAVKFQRRVNVGRGFRDNESRWMEGRECILSGDYVGGDGRTPGDFVTVGPGKF